MMLCAYASTAAFVAATISGLAGEVVLHEQPPLAFRLFCSSSVLNPRKSLAIRVMPLRVEKNEEPPVRPRVATMRGTTMRKIFQSDAH